jgi:hypothetical protein
MDTLKVNNINNIDKVNKFSIGNTILLNSLPTITFDRLFSSESKFSLNFINDNIIIYYNNKIIELNDLPKIKKELSNLSCEELSNLSCEELNNIAENIVENIISIIEKLITKDISIIYYLKVIPIEYKNLIFIKINKNITENYNKNNIIFLINQLKLYNNIKNKISNDFLQNINKKYLSLFLNEIEEIDIIYNNNINSKDWNLLDNISKLIKIENRMNDEYETYYSSRVRKFYIFNIMYIYLYSNILDYLIINNYNNNIKNFLYISKKKVCEFKVELSNKINIYNISLYHYFLQTLLISEYIINIINKKYYNI